VIGRLVVVGVGLIGGSFAAALRRAGAVREVVGLGRTREALGRARELGLIDAACDDAAEALRGADLVMLAMPVGATRVALERIAPHLGPATIVTDAGSTKTDVVAAARAVLGPAFARFVPGHPIAGAEKSGADAAFPDLFRGRKTVLTPGAETSPEALRAVRAAWESSGAEVREMSPDAHDAIFAAVSHLPHLLAYALVHDVASRPQAATLFEYAASGFRDFTRIASSHPEMWRDICVANRAALSRELVRYRAALDAMQRLVDAGDGPALEALFRDAREARDRWIAAQR
jgi:prephenate dehydrogenase